jgi:hypothetical protein
VYVAGINTDVNGYSAVVWINGTATNLANGVDAWATSVFVSGSDVYVAGHGAKGYNYDVAKVWKYGKDTSLTKGESNAWANAVFVSGGDVYVAGMEVVGGAVAKVWKNGVATSLTGGSEANSVFVSDNGDVYVAGVEYSGVAKIWKNGVATTLASNASANAVFVSGSDVYVAGTKGYAATTTTAAKFVAVVWKNGIETELASGENGVSSFRGYIYSVFVSGSDVYVAGYNYNDSEKRVATIWKNSKETALTNGQSHAEARSVFVSDNGDVYVAGTEANPSNGYYDVAKYWKNGTETILGNSSQAYSIVVK